jgi:hypothetical protein
MTENTGSTIPDELRTKAEKVHSDAAYCSQAQIIGLIARALLAEREATKERAAKICEEQAKEFLSPEYAIPQPLGSLQERFACGECAAAIRGA